MKVVFYNPSHELLNQISKKCPDQEVRPCNEITLEGVLDIKDLSRVASCDFAIYKKEHVIYCDTNDFSSMEVQL